MKRSQFLGMLLSTTVFTYLMNDFILEGDYFWAGMSAFFVFQNLFASYRITKFIRMFEKSQKNGGK